MLRRPRYTKVEETEYENDCRDKTPETTTDIQYTSNKATPQNKVNSKLAYPQKFFRSLWIKNEKNRNLPRSSNNCPFQKKFETLIELNNNVLCLYLHGVTHHDLLFNSTNVNVSIHVCDEQTGKYLPISKVPHRSEVKNSFHMEQILYSGEHNVDDGMMPLHFICDKNEEIIIPIYFKEIINASTIILFEVFDLNEATFLQSTERVCHRKTPSFWAFLKPVSKNGDINIGFKFLDSAEVSADMQHSSTSKKCQLQLFQYQIISWMLRRQAKRDGFLSSDVPFVFLQYRYTQLTPVNSSLNISIGPSSPPHCDENCNNQPSKKDMIGQRGSLPREKLGHQQNIQTDSIWMDEKVKSRMRLPDEACLTPEELIFSILDIGNAIVNAMAFSNDGKFIAVATWEHDWANILIYELARGKRIITITHSHHDIITYLQFNRDDSFLGSSSKDGKIKIWSFVKILSVDQEKRMNNVQRNSEEDSETYCKNMYEITGTTVVNDTDIYTVNVLVFPSLFFPSRFHFLPTVEVYDLEKKTAASSFLVSGSHRNDITLWNYEEEQNLGFLSGNIHHTAPITAISVDDEKGIIYTGDSCGFVLFWRPQKGYHQVRKGSDFVLIRQLNGYKEFSGKEISNISTNRTSNQLIISTKGGHHELFLYDISSNRLALDFFNSLDKIRNYDEIGDFVQTSALSPDGHFVVAGTTDGAIYYWDALVTGSKTKVCTDNFFKSRVDVTTIIFVKVVHKTMLKFLIQIEEKSCPYIPNISLILWNKSQHMVAVSYADANTPILFFSKSKTF